MGTQRDLSYLPTLEIIPRRDGAFDLFEKDKNGRLTLLSSHDNLGEARKAKAELQKPISQLDLLNLGRN